MGSDNHKELKELMELLGVQYQNIDDKFEKLYKFVIGEIKSAVDYNLENAKSSRKSAVEIFEDFGGDVGDVSEGLQFVYDSQESMHTVESLMKLYKIIRLKENEI